MKRNQAHRSTLPAEPLILAAMLLAPALSYADTIYLAGAGSQTIETFDSATGAHLGTFATTTGYPHGMAFDNSGNLYAANYGNGTIERFTPDGIGSVFATGLQGPEALAFDSEGNQYVGDFWTDTIMKFTQDGVGSVLATGVDSPAYMVIEVPEPSVPALVAFCFPALFAPHRCRVLSATRDSLQQATRSE